VHKEYCTDIKIFCRFRQQIEVTFFSETDLETVFEKTLNFVRLNGEPWISHDLK
jgi:hypothetical protein